MRIADVAANVAADVAAAAVVSGGAAVGTKTVEGI